VTVTMVFVLLSDVTPEAKRADAFLRVGAFSILASLVMPPFAAWLMKSNPWYELSYSQCNVWSSILTLSSNI
jgi:hypothetical protein